MKKLIAASLTAAVVCASSAIAETSDRVPGESLDSGLGALASSYTGEEFMKFSADHVPGEKQDSGLGSISSEELHRIVSTYENAAGRSR